MKTQEAIDFIKQSLLDGSTETEITAILMTEDSIGRNKPTAEIIAGLFERASEPGDAPTDDTPAETESETERNMPAETETEGEGEGEGNGDAPTDDAPTSPKGHVYEKWKVGIDRNGKIVNKIAKLRTMIISDALADMLNRAGTTGNGFAIRYIKK